MKTLMIVIGLTSVASANPIGITAPFVDMEMQGQPTSIDGIVYSGVMMCRWFDADNARCSILVHDAPSELYPRAPHWDVTRDPIHETGTLGFSDEDLEISVFLTGDDMDLSTFTDLEALDQLLYGDMVGMEFEWYHPAHDVMFTSYLYGTSDAGTVRKDSGAPEPSGLAAMFIGLLALLPMVRRS